MVIERVGTLHNTHSSSWEVTMLHIILADSERFRITWKFSWSKTRNILASLNLELVETATRQTLFKLSE